MIAKVRSGKSFAKLNQYNYREGEAEDHHDPHRVGGNVIGDDPRSLTEEFNSFAARNPRVKSPVWHASLRLAPGEHLTDDQWDHASRRFLQEMGFLERGGDGYGERNAPYIAMRHAEDHVHIVASRVRFDGTSVNIWRDQPRSHLAARAVEHELGLSSPQPSRDPLARVTKGERESSLRRGEVPERAQLREAVAGARDGSDGTRSGFEANLRDAGVSYRANEASTGRMNGYSFSLPGWSDGRGEPIWLKAKEVDRNFRWKQLSQDLESIREGRATSPTSFWNAAARDESETAQGRWWRYRVDRDKVADRAPDRRGRSADLTGAVGHRQPSEAGRALAAQQAKERELRTVDLERGRGE